MLTLPYRLRYLLASWDQGLTRAVLAVYTWALLGSISNTWSSIRTGTGTLNSARSTRAGSGAVACRCARSIAPAPELFDYTDQKPRVIDPTTGEVIEGELSVAVLRAPTIPTGEALAIAGGLR